MSKNVEQTWAYYLNGRKIELYQLTYAGATEDVTYSVRIPEFENHIKLIYPDESITDGLMFEGTSKGTMFVHNDPNELGGVGSVGNEVKYEGSSKFEPTVVDETSSPDETSHLNLNRLQALACIDYINGMIAEQNKDVQLKEYYMREFYSKLGDNESNKRGVSIASPSVPFAIK